MSNRGQRRRRYLGRLGLSFQVAGVAAQIVDGIDEPAAIDIELGPQRRRRCGLTQVSGPAPITGQWGAVEVHGEAAQVRGAAAQVGGVDRDMGVPRGVVAHVRSASPTWVFRAGGKGNRPGSTPTRLRRRAGRPRRRRTPARTSSHARRSPAGARTARPRWRCPRRADSRCEKQQDLGRHLFDDTGDRVRCRERVTRTWRCTYSSASAAGGSVRRHEVARAVLAVVQDRPACGPTITSSVVTRCGSQSMPTSSTTTTRPGCRSSTPSKTIDSDEELRPDLRRRPACSGALNVSRSSAPLLAHPALIRSRAKPTWAKAAMPEVLGGVPDRFEVGMADRSAERPLPSAALPRPPTGASGIMNARLPASRIRSISSSDQSTSWRSIWVTGMRRSACPSTTSSPTVPGRLPDAWIRSKRPSRATWMIGPTRNVGLRNCTSIPRSSHHASRPTAPESGWCGAAWSSGWRVVGQREVVDEPGGTRSKRSWAAGPPAVDENEGSANRTCRRRCP